jgi:hypothetical protein
MGASIHQGRAIVAPKLSHATSSVTVILLLGSVLKTECAMAQAPKEFCLFFHLVFAYNPRICRNIIGQDVCFRLPQ